MSALISLDCLKNSDAPKIKSGKTATEVSDFWAVANERESIIDTQVATFPLNTERQKSPIKIITALQTLALKTLLTPKRTSTAKMLKHKSSSKLHL